MAENPNGQEKETQPTTASSTLEWGPWFLWLLASITAGGLLLNKIFLDRMDIAFGMSTYAASILGAILVGFMPWLARKRQVSKFVWWLCIFISTALFIIALTMINADRPLFFSYYLNYRLAPSIVGAFLLALVTRGIGKRKLSSRTRWWEWVLAGITILIIGYIMFIVVIVTSIQ